MYKRYLFYVLLMVLVGNIAFRIYQYHREYLVPFDRVYWESRYLQSQWVVPNSQNSIGDDGLYAYAGSEYIRGRDPTTLNAEIPPLGKYLIGLSIVLFRNQNIFALLSGLFALFFFYKVNRQFFLQPVYALLPVVLFSFEPLFFTQLRAPFLDTLYLGFFLVSCLFFLKERFIFSGVFLGFMMATKASSATFLLVFAMFVLYMLYMHKFKNFGRFLLLIPVSFSVFLMTYIVFFLQGNGPIAFLKVQSYVLNFYSEGAKAVPHSVWQMLLTGKWPTWFGTVETVQEWQLTWPILLAGTVFFVLFLVFQRLPKERIFFCFLWVLLYLVFLTIIPVFPRYLLLILPFLYNISICFLPFFAATRQQ